MFMGSPEINAHRIKRRTSAKKESTASPGLQVRVRNASLAANLFIPKASLSARFMDRAFSFRLSSSWSWTANAGHSRYTLATLSTPFNLAIRSTFQSLVVVVATSAVPSKVRIGNSVGFCIRAAIAYAEVGERIKQQNSGRNASREAAAPFIAKAVNISH